MLQGLARKLPTAQHILVAATCMMRAHALLPRADPMPAQHEVGVDKGQRVKASMCNPHSDAHCLPGGMPHTLKSQASSHRSNLSHHRPALSYALLKTDNTRPWYTLNNFCHADQSFTPAAPTANSRALEAVVQMPQQHCTASPRLSATATACLPAGSLLVWDSGTACNHGLVTPTATA